MFRGFTATNYRAFEYARFYPRPLTFLLGPNNSGKSSLLQLLKILSQTALFSSLGERRFSALNLGGPFATVLDAADLFRDRCSRGLSIQIECDLEHPGDEYSALITVTEILHYAARIGIASDRKDAQHQLRDIRRQLTSNAQKLSERSYLRLIGETFDEMIREPRDEARRLLEVSDDYMGVASRRNPHQVRDQDVRKRLESLRDTLKQEVRFYFYFQRVFDKSTKVVLDFELSREAQSIGMDRAKLLVSDEEVIGVERRGVDIRLEELAFSDSGDRSTVVVASDDSVDLKRGPFAFLRDDGRHPGRRLFVALLNSIRRSMSTLSPVYVGPHRGKPSSVYVVPEQASAVDYLSEVVRRVSEDQDRAGKLNRIASSFGFHIDLPKLLEAVYALKLGRPGLSEHFDASSVGFGLVHLIPILDALAFVADGRMVVVEQPEAHLHPELHAKLADAFISMKNALPHASFLVETHSDHLLSRVGRRMKDSQYIRPDEVAIFYVDQDLEGISSIRALDIDERGDFEWPLGFVNSKLQDQIGQLPEIEVFA